MFDDSFGHSSYHNVADRQTDRQKVLCQYRASVYADRGATTAEKLRGTKVWVQTPGRLRPAPGQRPGWGECWRGRPLPLWGSGGVIPGKFLKTQMLNPAFWWLLHSLVGSQGRVYPSKQQACQGLNQLQNFNFSAVVAPLVVRTKNHSNGNYETFELHATRHLGP